MNRNEFEELATRSRDLEERSGAGSALSEERDRSQEGHRIEEDLEKQSNSSHGCRSVSHSNSRSNSNEDQLETQSNGSRADSHDDHQSNRSVSTMQSAKAVFEFLLQPVQQLPLASPQQDRELGMKDFSAKLSGTSWCWCHDGMNKSAEFMFLSSQTLGGEMLKPDLVRWVATGPNEITLDDGLGGNVHILTFNAGSTGFYCGHSGQRGYVSGRNFTSPDAAGAPTRRTVQSGSGSHSGSGTGSGTGGGSGIGSGSGSGNCRSLMTRGATASSSSENSGSVWESMTSAQQTLVEGMMADLAATHGLELDNLQVILRKLQSRDTVHTEDNSELLAKIKAISGEMKQNEDLQEKLDVSKISTEIATEERDNLIDEIAGLKAMHEARQDRQIKDMVDVKAAHKLANEQADIARKLLVDENATEVEEMLQEIAAGKNESAVAAAELQEMTRMKLIRKEDDEAKLNHVEALLAASQREVARRDASDSQRGHGLTDLDKADNLKKQRALEELLMGSRESNQTLNNSLTEQRLEMLAMQEAHKRETDQMRGLLVAAQPAKRKELKARSHQKDHHFSALASIDEGFDDDDLASQAASDISGVVSSDGETGCVGNLKDFDDNTDERVLTKPSAVSSVGDLEIINNLREELAEWKLSSHLLRDEAAGKEATSKSKLSRLLEQVELSKIAQAATENEVSRLTEVSEDASKESKENLLALERLEKQLLHVELGKDIDEKAMNQRFEDAERNHNTKLEAVQQHLAYAMEAKRLMGLRLADTQHELNVTEERNAQVVANLSTRLKVSLSGQEEDPPDGLQVLEEERNLLRNELECQTVRYETLLENGQHQHAVDLAKLEDAENELLKERELNKSLDMELNELKKLLVEARAEKAATSVASATDEPTVPLAGKSKEARVKTSGQQGLSWLRCPTRVPRAMELQDDRVREVFKQQRGFVWMVLSALRGVVALLCTSDINLEITDASKEACRTWGCSALWGSSVTSLILNKSQASWLTNKLTHTSAGSVAYIGVTVLRSKQGPNLECSIICANLPPDIDGNSESMILIFERERESHESRSQSGLKQDPASSAGAPSVLSEDIQACDSISNVPPYGGGIVGLQARTR